MPPAPPDDPWLAVSDQPTGGAVGAPVLVSEAPPPRVDRRWRLAATFLALAVMVGAFPFLGPRFGAPPPVFRPLVMAALVAYVTLIPFLLGAVAGAVSGSAAIAARAVLVLVGVWYAALWGVQAEPPQMGFRLPLTGADPTNQAATEVMLLLLNVYLFYVVGFQGGRLGARLALAPAAAVQKPVGG